MIRAALSEALDREVDRWCKEPMVWGQDDCALAVANVIRDALGYDPAAPWRTGYRDQDGADAALGAMGLGHALRAVARVHGWTRITPARALTGDVGVILQGRRPCVVICRAQGWFMGRSETGASLIPAENKVSPCMSVRIAWSVLP